MKGPIESLDIYFDPNSKLSVLAARAPGCDIQKAESWLHLNGAKGLGIWVVGLMAWDSELKGLRAWDLGLGLGFRA